MNIYVVTGNLIERREKFLLVQEGHEFAYGLWNFPSGKLEEEITLIENAVKEAKEETGYDVKIKGLVGVYQRIVKNDRNVVFLVFASSIVGEKMHKKFPPGEIIQAKWFSYNEIKKLKLRHKHIRQAVDDYKRKGVIGLSVIKWVRE